MVKITNNSDTYTVTRGAYESFYKPLGYNIVDENNDNKSVELENEKNIDDNDKVNLNDNTQEKIVDAEIVETNNEEVVEEATEINDKGEEKQDNNKSNKRK